ncbi:MAG: FAD-dependent oxidoreductase [Oscillospiraceae bacterium]|jgi:formate dehydrogenase major subunit|nr:FAD-dependent oxidoreductase [Oscillospiraceae bacterium]
MKIYTMNIDGREVTALPGQTILEVARENGIDIPTLCYDERTEIYGACGLCVVEVEGNAKLVKACATEISDNMVVRTKTARVRESRRTNLELLLSNHTGDCRGPCQLNCPAGTDCQGYVGLIANGEYDAALRLIKEKIPLPASLGRVCPHPCETACRRGLVEQPVSIAWLKRFAGDLDLSSGDPYLPEIAEETGKTVAVIGGGPYGLSVAYFLRRKGHDVTIIDAMPKLGGMLRYGIPEYRLPKAVLDLEIDLIEQMGVTIVPNTKIGVDMPFAALREKFDAVCIGIGAWVSTGTGCAGEDLPGVLGGIDFLRSTVRGEPITLGRRVAVVGGGNTAMDACRTAVRLGADVVYNIYRRTKDEMPADRIEIDEAVEEGVVFKNLTNPLEILAGEDGRANRVVLQVMRLGEPDKSGRRAPVPIEGETETIEVDSVILATGQAVNAAGIDGVELTRKQGIAYDKATYMTAIEGVFAGGDCGNDKISIAVEAIADAEKSSKVIDAYLHGESIGYKRPYMHERDDVDEKTFEDRERLCRPEQVTSPIDERRDNFLEIYETLTEEEAQTEAARCLECGCGDYFECHLVDYARQYCVRPERFAGEKNKPEYFDDHPFILRDPNKCVLCGKCVRVCAEVVGVGALGLTERGFDAVVRPALGRPLQDAGCVSCGMCISVCPTGALQEKLSLQKSVPLKTEKTETTCSYCSVGCSICVETHGNLLIKSLPDDEGVVNGGLLCHRGRFGFDGATDADRLPFPLAKQKEGDFVETNYHDALMLTAKGLQRARAIHGVDAAAIAVSPRLTNEEIYAVRALADAVGAKLFSFDNVPGGIETVLGSAKSPNTIDELRGAELIIAVGFDPSENPVVGLKLRYAAKAGAKVVLINPFTGYGDLGYASEIITTDDSVELLRGALAELINNGKTSSVAGFDELKASLADVTPSDASRVLAQKYAAAKKAMFVFQRSVVSHECAATIAQLALVSGHIGSPRDGILQVLANNNSQGLLDLGISAGAETLAGVKALLVFGEDPDETVAAEFLPDLEFLAVCDTHLTHLAEWADVVLPGTGSQQTDGTYTNTEGRLLPVRGALLDDDVLTNWQLAQELAHVFERDAGWASERDIATEMTSRLAWYDPAALGELTPTTKLAATLHPVAPARLIDRRKSADHLKRRIDALRVAK